MYPSIQCDGVNIFVLGTKQCHIYYYFFYHAYWHLASPQDDHLTWPPVDPKPNVPFQFPIRQCTSATRCLCMPQAGRTPHHVILMSCSFRFHSSALPAAAARLHLSRGLRPPPSRRRLHNTFSPTLSISPPSRHAAIAAAAASPLGTYVPNLDRERVSLV